MDYPRILRGFAHLENLGYTGEHDFSRSWPRNVPFPSDIGEDYITDVNRMTVRLKSMRENFHVWRHGENLFEKLYKYIFSLTIIDDRIMHIKDNSGFVHHKNNWKDFSLENPTIPEIVWKARALIHGPNWLDSIPVEIDYRKKFTVNSIGKKKL